MKKLRAVLISAFATLLLLCTTLFGVGINEQKAQAAYIPNNAYASALVETSINTNYNVATVAAHL
mgnify:CR=1 FL=1